MSNTLANALQLLIVSDLIESRLGPALLSRNLLNGVGPIVETVSPQVVDVLAPCASAVDIISPCAPVIDTIIPNYYGGITETITPNIYGGYSDAICSNPFGITETITPNYYGGWTETITPNLCGATEIISPNLGYQNIATVTPNIYGGVTEVISNSPCAPQLPLFGGVNEIISPPCGPNYYNGVADMIPSCGPNYYGNINEIIPNSFYGGIPEFTSAFNPGCLGGVTEVISGNPYAPNMYGNFEVISTSSPCNSILNSLPEVITPSYGSFYTGIPEFSPYSSNCYGVPEIISNPYMSNCYGGFKEVITPTGPFAPVAAEVLLPSAIPAQLTCNFGYMPTTVPCVSVNVEALPFDGCGCGYNGYPKGFYY